MKTVYFDYNATTPLDPSVREAMLPFLTDLFGNPSSVHHVGRRVRALLDDARARASQTLGCRESELVFTSGGTEANNLAILGSARTLRSRGRHLITSAIEHPAVLRCFESLAAREDFELTLLPVGRSGVVDPGDVSRAIRPDTILVSVMSANNETGILQPFREIGRLCRERGVLFHTDAVQSFGKLSFGPLKDCDADLVCLCGHKFHGPKGAGAVYVRSPFQIQPLSLGGPQENERRSGTEHVGGIIGLVEAICRFLDPPVFPGVKLRTLTDLLAAGLTQVDGVGAVGLGSDRLENTVSMTVRGADSISLLAALDLEGFCASSGSACSAGSIEPSHVLTAMGYPQGLASSFVRFSLGRESNDQEVRDLMAVWPGLITRLRG